MHWIKRFIISNGKRHPESLGEAEVTEFLNHLASERKVAASTQNQALSALLFLYREVLGRKIDWLHGIQCASRPARLPVGSLKRIVLVLAFAATHAGSHSWPIRA